MQSAEATHEPLREPGLDARSGLLRREQEQYAAGLIEKGIEAAERAATGIDAATAQVIAACLHRGHATVLEHFAATGHVDPAAALAEIDTDDLDTHHVPWIAAFWDFLERITDSNPDQPETDHQEPSPQVFIQPTGSEFRTISIGKTSQ